jgi:hypothetical protein
LLLIRRQEEPALAFLAGAARAAEAVNVRLAVTREPDLHHVCDVGEIHASRGYVGREEDARLAVAEVVCGAGARALGELGVNFKSAQAIEGRVAFEAAAKLVKDGRGERDFGCAVEVENGLEGLGRARLRGLVRRGDELVERGHDVFEAGDVDELLRNTRVCGLFVLVDAAGKVEAGAQGAAHEVDDVARDGGGEHEVLALDLFGVGQEGADLVDFLGEAFVEQAVGFIQDQGVEVGRFDARVVVGENVKKAAGRADEEMAALALCLLQHHALLSAADGNLHNDTRALRHLFGLDGDLLCQLAGRRDDDSPDVVGLGPLVSARLLGELGVVCDDALNNGDEEAERFSGARLCLRDTAEVS